MIATKKITALLILVSLSSLSHAQTTSQKLQQLQKDLIEQKHLSIVQSKKLEELRKSLQSLNTQQKSTLDRLDKLADEVASLENDLSSVSERVVFAEKRLIDIKEQKNITESRIETLKGSIRNMLSTLYRERSSNYLALLTQSKNLSELLIKLDYANISGNQNIKIVQEMHEAVNSLQSQEEEQEKQAKELKALQAERSANLSSLRQRRIEQEKLLAELKKTASGKNALAAQTKAQQALTAQSIDKLVGQVMQEKTRIEAERKRRLEEERRRIAEEKRRLAEAQERARQEALRIARLRAEQERRAKEAQLARERAAAAEAAKEQQQRAAALAREERALRVRQESTAREQAAATIQLQPLPEIADSNIGFPLPGGQVYEPYGTGGAQWVVLSGSESSQAVAVLEGNVLAATYYASLGWVVLIDHGSGSITGYFGLQNSQVTVGTRVARGEAIGTIGGSPIFGSNRMAFQLRRNNQPVPPNF